MKTSFITFMSLLLAWGITADLQAQKLGSFASSIEKKVGPKTIQVPYTNVISYLGYAAPGTEDEVKDGKKFYYIYIWVPAVAPELGVRMLSPVAGNVPKKNLTTSPNYEANAGSSAYFDTYITLEKSSISKKDDISEEAVASATWTTLAKNDDSSEMPPLPSGQHYNSLMRYKSETGDPLKALTVGLYRVGFTTYKTGEVEGSFLAQIGAPIKLPGVAMGKTVAELLQMLE